MAAEIDAGTDPSICAPCVNDDPSPHPFHQRYPTSDPTRHHARQRRGTHMVRLKNDTPTHGSSAKTPISQRSSPCEGLSWISGSRPQVPRPASPGAAFEGRRRVQTANAQCYRRCSLRRTAGMTGLPQTQETPRNPKKPTHDRTTRGIGRHGPVVSTKPGEAHSWHTG
jgi:hypothetical protein